MIGHFIIQGLYKGKLHRVSQIHRNPLGQITHFTVYPIYGTADTIKEFRVAYHEIDLHQVA